MFIISNNVLFIEIVVLILVVLIAAFYDIKYKRIPNTLTFSTIIFGIIINLIYSFLINNLIIILNSIIISAMVFFLSYLLWKFKVWGGGDVKLFTAIAIVLPIHPVLSSNIFDTIISDISFPIIASYPFPFTVILNSILISFPVIIFILLLNYFRNVFKFHKFTQVQWDSILKSINSKIKYNLDSILNSISNFILNSIKNSITKYIKNKRLNYINFKKLANSLIISAIFILITMTIKNYKFISLESILYIFFTGILISLIFSKLIKYLISNFKNFIKKATYNEVQLNNLKEGMILNEVLINVKKVNNLNYDNIVASDTNDRKFESIIINEKNNFDVSKKKENYCIKSNTAAGLTKNDIVMLKYFAEKNIISNYIPIKLGIPFAPSIAISFFISIFIGDIISIFYVFINFIF